MAVRIVLVDDHTVFREGMRVLLREGARVSMVGEAASAREALPVVAAHDPDVVVVDISLPDVHGLSLTRQMVRSEPGRKVLVLSADASSDLGVEARQAGALGLVSKQASSAAFTWAVEAVSLGHTSFGPEGAEGPYARADGRRGGGSRGRTLASLSPREREVFDFIVQGQSNESIAARLQISVKTIETHRGNINRKLGVHSSAEVVRFAAIRGLLA